MPIPADQIKTLSFEDAIERLESLVAGMEDNQLALAEMVSSYEEGAQLLQLCRQRIDSARQRVELITTNLENPAKASLSAFDAAATEEPESYPSKTRVSSTRRTAPAKPNAPADDDDIRLF